MGPRSKVARPRHYHPLIPMNRVPHNQKSRRRAKGQMNQRPGRHSPTVALDKDLPPARMIKTAGQIHQRWHMAERAGPWAPTPVMTARNDLGQHRRRRPVAFLHRDHDFASGAKPETVGIAETRRQHFLRPPIRGYPADALVRGGKIKPARRIPLQPGRVIMTANRGGRRVGKTFVIIRLVVAIAIVQSGDLVAPAHVDFALGNL